MFTRILIVGTLPLLLWSFVGCCSSGKIKSGYQPEAFEIQLLKGVRWTSDTLRFDSALPGYHLTGGIGAIELHAYPETQAKRLVLEITTSPGMPANIEGFTLSWGDTVLNVSPFTGSNLAELLVKNAEGRLQIVSRRETQHYFLFQRSDSSVTVSFQPLALQLLGRTCVITWVDWYRR